MFRRAPRYSLNLGMSSESSTQNNIVDHRDSYRRVSVPLRTWALLRAVMAVTILAAVVAQISASIATAIKLERDVATTIANFFSFFTVLSNVAAAVVLLCAAILAIGKRRTIEPPSLSVLLVTVTTFMIITGVVYNVLLRNVELPQGSAPVPWSNEVLHLIAPLFLLLDLLLAPVRRRLPWRVLWAVLAFPIAWVTYTLVRGPMVVNPVTSQPYWYPYPFLDPYGPGGWVAVAGYVIAIAITFVVVGAGVIALGRRFGRHPSPE